MSFDSRILSFVHRELWPLSQRVAATWEEAGGGMRIGDAQTLMVDDQAFILHESEPTPGLEIAELCGEVLFPYQFNAIYDRLSSDPVFEHQLNHLNVHIDPEGRPEAIIDLKYESAEEHFTHISTIKPLLKLMPRLEVRTDTWHYDPQMELDNIVYHMEREGVDFTKAVEYYGATYYEELSKVTAPALMWRNDYWFEGNFVGHSLWALSPDKQEWYWVTPVMARTDLARKKLRIGNLMMLKTIEQAYHWKVKRINLGVDEMDYKNNFWSTRREFRPGLRRGPPPK